MKLYYKSEVIKQLKKLSPSERKKVIRKLELLSEDPLSGKSLRGELKGLYSLRVWPYRVIYEIKGKEVIIYSVSHRQSAYKK